MPTKRRAKNPRRKPVSAKTRAADDALREELRAFDVKKFAKMLGKAIVPPRRP